MTKIGIIVGSIASTSINRAVANNLPALAPEGVEFEFLDFSDLPMYSSDYDADYPEAGKAWKAAIEAQDGIIIVTPEYSRSLPGVLKNAMDWASRPWGTNSFSGRPVAIMGVSPSPIGAAAAQQHLRAILGHFNAPTMGQPEMYFQYNPAAYDADGNVVDETTKGVLQNFVDAAVAFVKERTEVPVAA